MRSNRQLVSFFVLITTLLAGQVFAQSSIQSLADSNACFAIGLYKKLAPDTGDIFLSPYSISIALSMTYRGARTGTEKEMAKVLHFGNNSEVHTIFSLTQRTLDSVKQGKNQLYIANSIWPQNKYPFLPGYVSFLKDNYGILITYLDYTTKAEEARQTINTWISNKTNAKIENLLPKGMLGENTRLVLTNAIYFKGAWQFQFDKTLTTDRDFHLTSSKISRTPQMQQTGNFGYAELDGIKMLELPYSKSQFTMIVLLPDKISGIQELESKLTMDLIKKSTELLQKREVLVVLPKFRMEKEFLLNKTLVSMGMRSAFEPNADFSGMAGTDSLYIAAVIHKAFADVNEEGTEAAAATAVIMSSTKSLREGPKRFVADHPFLFIIRHNKTGNILFIGRLSNPR